MQQGMQDQEEQEEQEEQEVQKDQINDPNEPGVEDWILKEGVRLGTMIASCVHELDLMIRDGREILELAQPSVPGKISIRWWSNRNKVGKEPYVFRWEQKKNGKWQANSLPLANLSKRANRSGIFKDGSEQVEIALLEIQRLMKVRQELLSALGKARQTLSNKVNGAQRSLVRAGETLEPQRRAALDIKAARKPRTV